MKLVLTMLLASTLFFEVACKKEIRPKDIDFTVACFNNAQQPATTFKVGDTVNFKFTGNPDRISFFSGEKGYQYDYRERTSDTGNNTILQFASAINTAGTSGAMRLFISTDFNGYTQQNAIDSIAVGKATWQDISGRASWATNATTASSGNISLSDFAVQNKPVYLAFQYEALSGATQTKWTLSNIDIRHYTADTSYTIDSTNLLLPAIFPSWLVSSGWGAINVTNPLVKFVLYSGTTATTSVSSISSTSSFVITGATSSASAVNTEDWLVTGPIDLHRVLPDAGVAIKDMSEDATKISKGVYASLFANYTYRFTRPGIYKVVFFASSDSKDGQNTLTRTIDITVQ